MGGAGRDGVAPYTTDRGRAEARVGTVVDKYTIVRLVGRGGMGVVYEARHAKLARRFAIKFLLSEVAADSDVLRRFENEAAAAGGLEHPNIAAVTDVGRTGDGSPYLVMEFLEGEDCGHLLGRLGPLPVPRAVKIAIQACRGLTVAHAAGIVHRDLKPENLFLTDAGDGTDLVKVLDFGMAKLRPSQASVTTGTGATFGTAHYMSPEQARGAGDVDQRSDVWSMGVVLYELLSDRKPFPGGQFLEVIYRILSTDASPLHENRPGLPVGLVTVIERAMKKEAAERWPTVAAFAQALLPFSGEGSSAKVRRHGADQTTQPTPVTAYRQPAKRGWRPMGIATGRGRVPGIGLAIAAMVAIIAVAVIRAVRPEPPSAAEPSATVVPTPPSPTPPPLPSIPSSLPASAPAAAPAVAAPSVPRLSEQFEHDSNTPPKRGIDPRETERRTRTKRPQAAAPAPQAAIPQPPIAPVADPPRPSSNPVKIDPANPY